MSNTVITNYTDLNGPSTKADSSVVVIVNKDGSLSVDQNLLGTLMGTDGSQSAGISVVRVGHEGKPDDATDSETDDEKMPHVTLSVDSYYNEPNSIIKYDSGAEMLQSLRIETRENSLVGFQNDHCYTPLRSPSQSAPEKSETINTYDESIIEICHTPPPKPIPSAKKITILEQQIIPKGKRILLKPTDSPIILKGNDVLNKPLPIKTKELKETVKPIGTLQKSDESSESSSISSSGDSIPDRDSDSDYKDTKDRSGSLRLKKTKLKPRILKTVPNKATKLEPKAVTKLKPGRNILRKEYSKEKILLKHVQEKKETEVDLESILPSSKISTNILPTNDLSKTTSKQTPKVVKKEKKTPAHVSALLSDMTSLFSTPDVIRRVSTDAKVPPKTPTSDKDMLLTDKKPLATMKLVESIDNKVSESKSDTTEKPKIISTMHKTYGKPKDKVIPTEKITKAFDPIPQLDDASLAQILQDTSGISPTPVKSQTTISTASTMNSPSLAGPLSPTLDLLGGLQPEEEGLTEDFLMSVAQLVASSENLQEVIDKQVLGKVDSVPVKTPQGAHTAQALQVSQAAHQQTVPSSLYSQTLTKSAQKTLPPRKDPIEIVRRDGRVITLPPIEAPATRSSKRKSQMEVGSTPTVEPPLATPPPPPPVVLTPEPQLVPVSKQYTNKKLATKKQEPVDDSPVMDKVSAESQESWNSEDDPNRLWCICKQPHNNRFMICCDGCEDWFHGKCVNITKAMGQQMEDQGIEWRCPNCVKKAKPQLKAASKVMMPQNKPESEPVTPELKSPPGGKDSSKTSCIVCKKPARVSSIYCSNTCIWKHAQDSLGNQTPTSKEEGEPGKSSEKQKAESRVIVYERKSGRLLAGPNAPTAENLKSWLQSNPTFEVVRPGTLSTIKPGIGKTPERKKLVPNKIQTTLNFAKVPKKFADQLTPRNTSEVKERREIKLIPTPKMEPKPTPQLKSPVTPKSQQATLLDTPTASTSSARLGTEPRKLMRAAGSRSQSSHDKAPSVSPSTSRRKDSGDKKIKMTSGESIRDNVRKSLQEQMSVRMGETTGAKFTEKEILQFANETEDELHELFRDVGMKYKAKYRSLMFNIKDRKNLSLWEKICDRSITPYQLVRLSPEELASQELAQWRDKEAKHQLELIKKSELDLLAASKTYVLKTHKGEEVMETKESVSTELDPNVPVEDVVTALNDSTVGPDVLKENSPENTNKPEKEEKKHSSKKRSREDSSASHSKKSRRDSKRDSGRKSRSSRKRSDSKDDSNHDQRRSLRRSEKKLSRARSPSRERSRIESKDKSDASERPRRRSSSREKSRRLSKSHVRSRSKSQGRDRSGSRERSRKRSQSRDSSKRRRSRSKRRRSSDDKSKLRSRSQDNVYNKSKHDSTDSDSIERPKSAMLKEAHPEYDPHEPMITSAFSEEDLRKSREDVFEENYRNEMSEFESEYDPSKLVDSNILMPETPYPIKTKQDKVSEAESDQEPSSTVDNSSATVWSGCINMVDVARFYVAAHEVSGSSVDLEDDLSTELDIVGRINPDTVWDYITKMRKTSNKDIVILKLQTANDEEKMQYIALYSYLSSRNRLGVVKVSNMTTVKDFYIVPVPANTALPAVLLPFDGPGIGEIKTHLLIAIVIRQRKKRLAPNIPTDVPAKSRKRSYTPPASPKRRALPLPAYTSATLSNTVKDKIAASLAAADDDEPYSPGSSNSSNGAPINASGLASNTLRSKMEELNRQIEEQKQQILKMAQADSSVGEDEAYSPSRPLTPPVVSGVAGVAGVASVPLADIALPSNLQEILATIKQRSETSAADVDMRTLPLP